MQIIIRPVLTEKMTAQGEKLNRFAFIVDRRANKIQIRQAVEDMYGVVVTDVNTVNYMGKEKSRIQERSPRRALEPLQEGDCNPEGGRYH